MVGRDNPKVFTASGIRDILSGVKERIPLVKTDKVDTGALVLDGNVLELDSPILIQRGTVDFDFPGSPGDDSWASATQDVETVSFNQSFGDTPAVSLVPSSRNGSLIQRGPVGPNEVELRYTVYSQSISSGATVNWVAIGSP